MTPPGFASELALSRFRILQPHLEDDIPLTVLAREGGVSVRTLRRWSKRYEKDGVAGLERRTRSDSGKRRKIAPELEDLAMVLVAKQRRPTLKTLHRHVCAKAEDLGLPAPKYGMVAEIARQLSPAAKALASGREDIYRNQYELVHRREAECSNQFWQADHTVLDIILHDPKGREVRPWLTVVVDDYSRAIAGYFLSFDAPSAMNTALALRQAIWRKENPNWMICGIPETLYVDNGSDFTSIHIQQACVALKVQLIHSFPGRPRGRGRIERLFRTINDMFLSDLPGRVIEGKALSKAELTLDDLKQRFENFLHDIYHRRKHGSTGQAPQDRWQAGGFLPAMPETRQALDMLLLRVRRLRRVSRDGIRFGGERYSEPTLAAFIGDYIEVLYDPRDLAEIHVYHEGNFICRALSSEHVNAPRLEDIQKTRNAVRRDHRGQISRDEHGRNKPVETRGRSSLKLYRNDD